MRLASSFPELLQPLSAVMTAPTFANLLTVLAGWVFARRRTVTAMLVAAGVAGRRHHSAYHRLFAAAEWSPAGLGLAVLGLVLPWLPEGRVHLAVDDTLARKRGKRMFGCGMHVDPLISSRRTVITNWGHSWVVLGVVAKFPFRDDRWFCLPVLFRLYRNRQTVAAKGGRYRTRPQLATDMLQTLCAARPDRRFHAVADSAYGGHEVVQALPENCDLTSRLHLDARLHEPAPEREPGSNGRPRLRGDRLPTPRQMLSQRCRRVDVKIYGRTDKVRFGRTSCRLYKVPDRPVAVVAVEPLTGGRGLQAFFSTIADSGAGDIPTWYARRWSMEQTFHDAKQQLGFEQPQGWTRRAVERTAPTAMLLYTAITLWFAARGHKAYSAPRRPWYPAKSAACFADMIATLKAESLRERVSATPASPSGFRKLRNALLLLAGMAA